MSKFSAVIDLGTNTFQLLIGFFDENGLVIVENVQKPVQLGKGAMKDQIIQKDALERARIVLHEFNLIIHRYSVSEVNAIGTSIIRQASNAHELVDMIQTEFDFKVSVISGEKEASYIFEGIVHSLPNDWDKKSLAMDIGGGSVEFILFEDRKVYWKHSFELGGLKLQSLFHRDSEFDISIKDDLQNYVRNALNPLFEIANKMKPQALIGAAGAFETIWDLEKASKGMIESKILPFQSLDVEIFYQHLRFIEESSYLERKNMAGMKQFRASIFPYANTLIDIVLKELQIKELYLSNYSLKEGFLCSAILSNTDS